MYVRMLSLMFAFITNLGVGVVPRAFFGFELRSIKKT
jgi:hypothetical protein